jgi:type VI protein secretion system component VasF
MTSDEQILAVLNQMLDTQRQALANQEQAIAQQKLAIARQTSHLRLYKVMMVVAALSVAVLVSVFFFIAGPYLLRT